MENASKALLMAGGVLMAILVISMLVLMFSNLTNVFSEENQANREAQIVKFNMEYESYNREGVRGTEILSLLAKVHDYNEYQSDYEGTNAGYSPITVNIDMSTQGNNLKYDDTDELKISTNYVQGKLNTQNAYDSIKNIKENAKESLEQIGGSRREEKDGEAELSDSDLETLTASLDLIQRTTTTVTKNEFAIMEIKEIQKTLSLMQRIFNPDDLKYNNENLIMTSENKNEVIIALNNFLKINNTNIQKYAKQYYQYQQFKKSYFDCEGVTYDENTGRVKQLDFKYTRTGD